MEVLASCDGVEGIFGKRTVGMAVTRGGEFVGFKRTPRAMLWEKRKEKGEILGCSNGEVYYYVDLLWNLRRYVTQTTFLFPFLKGGFWINNVISK